MLSGTILKLLPLLIGVTTLSSAGFAQGIIDQENDPTANTSFGCGSPPIGLGALFQSFVPSRPSLIGVELRLRAGGGFPADGFSTNVKIRLDDPAGEVLDEATTFVPGPLAPGTQLLVRYDFTPFVPLSLLETYVIEWETPGDAILTWMGRQDDSYPGGHSFGCFGIPIPEQDLNFITFAAVNLDIKPGSCPNSFNRNSHGVLPVALVGSDSFDVLDVDLSTVLLSRADGLGGSVAANEGPPGPHSVFAEVATPFDGEPCDCHELEGDGITDLSMKFSVSGLELDGLPPGALVELVLTGVTLDGMEFEARDCIRLVPPGKPSGLLRARHEDFPSSFANTAGGPPLGRVLLPHRAPSPPQPPQERAVYTYQVEQRAFTRIACCSNSRSSDHATSR